jgi:gas vesicle protein
VSKRTRGLLIGAVSGAVLGAVLAWAVLSREETNGEETPGHARRRLQASTGEWFRLGTSILLAGRQMADMVRLA